ncbi:MAG: hypothetical protein ACODAU_10845 [Myxococcota bacterium]
MTWFPDPPEPEAPLEGARVPLRYEDVSQDGRIKLVAIPPSLGATAWRKRLSDHPLTRLGREEGILPILSRMVIECGDGPISVRRDLEGSGWFQLAHTENAAGEPERIIMNLWAEVHSLRGRTHGPPPEGVGERIRVGRVFAEHVMTRPFHPPEQRRVHRLPGGTDVPEVPPAVYPWRAPDRAAAIPAGATPLEPERRPDTAPIALGLGHTDSNQHVNSLVYPELFEQAALRRFADLGRPTDVLPVYVELAYRKPCFAGQRIRVVLQAYEHDGHLGAAGVFLPDDDPTAKPHCYASMRFS